MNEVIFLIQLAILLLGGAVMVYLGAFWVASWLSLLTLIANMFVIKQITLFSLDVTATDAYVVGILVAINLSREFYGDEASRKILRSSWGVMVGYVIFSRLHVMFIPSLHDNTQEHFAALFSPALRLTIGSVVVLMIAQFAEHRIFVFLRYIFRNRFFSFRSAASMMISQALDSVLFCTTALHGLIANPLDVITISILSKCLGILLIAPVLSLARRFLLPFKKDLPLEKKSLETTSSASIEDSCF